MPFQIIRNDITKVKTDAIVNTANPKVVVGPGVDDAIYNAAGRDWLLSERAKIGDLDIGEVAITPAGNLYAKYIIHESGPVWIDGNHKEVVILKSCYRKCLNLALKYNCESIAFPLLASGAYGFPKDVALRIAIDAFRTFLSEHEIDIYLVLYDSESIKLSETMFDGVKSFVNSRYSVMPMACSPMPILTDYDLLEDAAIGAAAEESQVFRSVESSKSLDDYIDQFENQEVLSFGEYLQQLINKKGLTNKEVYFESNLSKQYFSKIINNKLANPSKEKLLCIAVALKLNIDETKDFLLHAGYAISPYSKIDLVFEYYIENGIYDVYEISFALEDMGIEGGLWPELI
ncbi:MAG: macro domain-containing protein [Lachnospiraceae bacterium]|nr:macro domain-containing protein [Lachnospiraceae bacterium]